MQEQTQNNEGGSDLVVRPDPDLQDLIPSFMENRRNELVEIDQAIIGGDFETLRRFAHTWKGICRPYGFMQLEILSRSLEGAAERENQKEAQEMAALIRHHLDQVKVVYDH